MPENGSNDGSVNNSLDDRANDEGILNLNQDSVVFIVRVWPQPDMVAVGVSDNQMMRQCRGVVEHLESRARHYFLTWPELIRHLGRYVQCDEMTKPLTAFTGWRGLVRRMQTLVLRGWRQG